MALSDDVERIAVAAAAHGVAGEEIAAVLAVEPHPGERLYLCAFRDSDGAQSWLALEHDGSPVRSRNRVRDAASIAALCEIAEESAGTEPAAEPRVASLEYLDTVGAQARNGDFAAALRGAQPAVDELTRDIEANYKLELS